VLSARSLAGEGEPWARQSRAAGGRPPCAAGPRRSPGNLAQLLERKASPAEAEALVRSALAARRTRFGEDHPLTLRALDLLFRLRADRGAPEEAEAGLRDVLARRRRVLPAGHMDISESLVDLGTLLERRADPRTGEPLLREAIEIRRAGLPAGHWRIAQAESALGGCLLALGRLAEAEPLLVESQRILAVKRGATSLETQDASRRLLELRDLTTRTARPGSR
jgi:eukaryotic-like serine/threonine-protein kinase